MPCSTTDGTTSVSRASAWRRYWFEASFPTARLTGFRVVFFGLLAFDQWALALPKASFHGVGGFALSHLPAVDGWLPTPSVAAFTLSALTGGFLAFVIAAGAARRAALVALALLYGGSYLWSQIDSYQHHYLIAWLLVIACGLPTPRDAPASAPDMSPPRCRSWAFQLVYVQLGLLYFWAAVAKTGTAWLDGWTLRTIVGPCRQEQLDGLSQALGLHPGSLFVVAAVGIPVVELAAAFVYWIPRLRPLGFVLLPAMHVGIELLGLRIGLFSYYMIALAVVLLVPERLLGGLLARARPVAEAWTRATGALRGAPRPATAGLGIATAAGLAFAAPVPWRPELAMSLAGAAALCGLGAPQPWRATVQISAAVALLVVLHVSGSASSYHAQWAADLQRRGEHAAAAQHFETAMRLDADRETHFQLARAYRKLHRDEEALATLHEGVARQRELLARAEAALARDPSDVAAHSAAAAAHARLSARSAAMAVLEVTADAREDAAVSSHAAERHHADALAAVAAIRRLVPCRSAEASRLLWLLQGESDTLTPDDWDTRRAVRRIRRSAGDRARP